ncbi:MAG: hypothetical protein ACREUQ_02385 [Burkholderiales bacterium]
MEKITFFLALAFCFLMPPVLQSAGAQSARAGSDGGAIVAASDARSPAAMVEMKEAVITPPAPPAPPAPAVTPPLSEDGAITAVLKGAQAGNWKLALAGILSMLMFFLRNARESIPFFRGDRGGALLVMTLSILGAIATAFAVPGMKIDVNTIVTAMTVAFTAIGGWKWLSHLFVPTDKRKAAPATPPA